MNDGLGQSIRNVPKWIWIVGGLVLLVGITAPSDEERARMDAERSAEDAEMAQRVADAQTAAKTRFAEAVESRLDRCGLARLAMAAAADVGISESYDAARRGKEVCQVEWLAVGDIEVPEGVDDDTVDLCSTALYTFGQAAEQAAELLDTGNLSAQYEMRQALAAGISMENECRSALALPPLER